MRHARTEDLALAASLIARLRTLPGLVEKSPGVFYRKGKAFLHFHEHQGALFADIREGGDWRRLPATSAAEQKSVEQCARRACA